MTDFIVKFDENPSIDVTFKDVTIETKKPTLEKVEATISVNDHYSYTPSDGYDGIGKIDIDVDVPDIPPMLETTTVDITNNGTQSFFPNKGYDGISRLTARVNVPTPPPRLELKYVPITENGTTVIYPSEGYDGLGSININVNVADSYYDTFWDAYQQNGERTDYAYAFYGESWNDSIFKPKYPSFKCSAVIYMFYKSHITNIGDIDASQATRAENMFALCLDLQSLGEIDLRNAYIGYTFSNCKALKTIKKLVLSPDGTNGLYGTFGGCNSLENITIEGKFGSNVDFKSSSKLTTESVDSIGNAVIDLTGQTSQTVIFHKDVIAKMSDEQKAVFTNKNWTLVSSS